MEIKSKGSKQVGSGFNRYGMQVQVAAAALAVIAAVPLAVYAAVPNTFVKGTTILSKAVNDNFTYVDGYLSAIDERLSVFEAVLFPDDSTGNVDVIGNMEVGDGTDITPNGSVAGQVNIDGNGYKGRIMLDGSAMYVGHYSSARRLDLMTYGKSRLSITADGKVGVGTTSPDATLTLESADNTALTIKSKGNNKVYLGDPGSGDGGALILYDANGNFNSILRASGTSYLMGGYLGIGTTSPNYLVDVNGEIRAVKVTQTSDIRLKRDIRPLTHALEGIQCLQGVSYFLRDPLADQGLQYGLIAQEVERCYPELVSTDSDGYKSVSYDRLVAPLIEAVKTQQDSITEQNRIISSQQKALSKQEQITSDLASELAATNARMARLEALISRR